MIFLRFLINAILMAGLLINSSYSQTPIERNDTIVIGGIKQYIRIKGKNISKPILLILHGGPGSSLMNKTDQISNKLQQHFVVVQWDQRETGETLKLNKTSQPLTPDLFYKDTRDLVDSLLKRFHQPRLYLVGYSWGTVPGFQMADKNPELLYAYIAISPVINNWESEQLALDMLKKEMGSKAQKELSEVKIPFENAEQLYCHRKWLFKHSGQKFVSISSEKALLNRGALRGSTFGRKHVTQIFSNRCRLLIVLFIFLPGEKITKPTIRSLKDILIKYWPRKKICSFLINPVMA